MRSLLNRVRAVRDGRHDDAGFTLAETLVYIVISTVIGGILVTVTTVGLKNQSITQDRNSAVTSARTALERIDRDIRSADPLYFASPIEIQMEEQPDSTSTITRYVTYSVVTQSAKTSEITVGETDVTSAGVTTTIPTKVLIGNLVNVAASPVFTFAEQPPPYSPPSGVTSACVNTTSPSTYDPGCVGTITVALQVQPSTLDVPVSVSDKGTVLRNAS